MGRKHYDLSSSSRHHKKCGSQCKKKPSVNVYHFGDSFTDPGNLPFESYPGPELISSRDIPLGGQKIQLRVNPKGFQCDGLNWPFFVSNDLGFKLLKGSKINHIPSTKGKYIDFALSGAGQISNTNIIAANPPFNPPPPTGALSFTYEIETFKTLLNSPCTKINIESDDIFIYDDVGTNDQLQIMFAILTVPIPVVNQLAFIAAQITIYVNAVIANLTKLYDLGMRRLFLDFGDLAVVDYPILTKVSLIYPLLFGGTPNDAANFIQTNVVDAMVNSLNTKLDTFALDHPDLELNRLFRSNLLNNVRDNFGTNAVIYPFTQENPPSYTEPFNTQAGTGAWPIDVTLPIRNATNLERIDDSHFTQHTNRLYADLIIQWLNPVKKYCV